VEKIDIQSELDRMLEAWSQIFADLKSGRIAISESRRRARELDNRMKVIKKAMREEKRLGRPVKKSPLVRMLLQ